MEKWESNDDVFVVVPGGGVNVCLCFHHVKQILIFFFTMMPVCVLRCRNNKTIIVTFLKADCVLFVFLSLWILMCLSSARPSLCALWPLLSLANIYLVSTLKWSERCIWRGKMSRNHRLLVKNAKQVVLICNNREKFLTRHGMNNLSVIENASVVVGRWDLTKRI